MTSGRPAALHRLAAAALTSYDVEATRLVPLGHLENATFRVDAVGGHRYVLRLHRVDGDPFHPVRSRAEIESELTWLAALRDDLGEVAPLPLPARDGSTVVSAATDELPEGRCCVLLHWVEGRFYDAGLTPARLAAVGQLIGSLHDHAARFVPPAGFARPRLDRFTAEAASHARGTLATVVGVDAGALAAEVIDRASAAGAALDDTPESFGLIHGDLHQENYLFHRGRVAVIDFDDSGWGHFLYDLAVTVSELDHLPGRRELRLALLDGYRRVRSLPDRLDALLPPFVALRLLKIVLWVIEHRDRRPFGDWPRLVEGDLRAIRRELARPGRGR